MSYQDSSSDFTVSSLLLSYLDVRLPRFLPHGLMSKEARHLGPLVVRHDSLKPIQDGSRDIVFQGQAVHIPLEASVSRIPVLGNLVCEGLNTNNFTLPTQTIKMVQKWSMALDRWFLALRASGGQPATIYPRANHTSSYPKTKETPERWQWCFGHGWHPFHSAFYSEHWSGVYSSGREDLSRDSTREPACYNRLPGYYLLLWLGSLVGVLLPVWG